MRAHTATHLLHYALDKLLWWTKQAWSLVEMDYVRFDFSCKDPLSPQDIQGLEYSVNSWIKSWVAVITQEMSFDEAKNAWAKAFFEDKYWDTVRMVSITWEIVDDLDIKSIELCWWTHVINTQDIGSFKIIDHSSVASWVRRLTAVTWTKVAEEAQLYEQRLLDLASRLDCQPKQLETKIEKILKEIKHLESDHEQLQGKLICTHLEELHQHCELPQGWSSRWKWCIINVTWTSLEHHNFKDIINNAKSKWSDRNWIIYSLEWNFAIYVGTGDFSAKEFLKEKWLKWGWSDQFVQGKDPAIIWIFS